MNHIQNTGTLPPHYNGNKSQIIEPRVAQPSPRAAVQRGPKPPKRARQTTGTEQPAKRPMEKLCYTAAETCQVLAVSRKTLARLMERKLLRPLKLLRTHLFTRAELDRFLEESK